ncbi:unnamed protein product [Lymnaea stagnalis]|uniref:Pyridoxal phosphate homeostasis protein n=1 Tax=Lymnaea stagnalis TaxID=6523 RepID=A0AAV2HEV0_LYMST
MSGSSTNFAIARQLKQVCDKVQAAAARRPQHLQYSVPRLVAVSKTKGTDLVIEAYNAGQRHFGENYVVELYEKSNDIEIQDHCKDIKWHFIGRLQRNKVPKILEVPNLFVIETVDSERLAKALNDGWGRLKKTETLQVMAQVNTSGEGNKNGCSPQDTTKLVQYIREKCPSISLIGLMTIGSFDHDLNNQDKKRELFSLCAVRKEVCDALNISEKDLELSMGMSADYEHAIEVGSTNVRVGSTIFGDRGPPHGKTAPAGASTDSGKDGSDANLLMNKMESLDLHHLAVN